MPQLTDLQKTAVHARNTSFLLGPAGTGKSTALQHRVHRLLQAGEPAYTLLVLVGEGEHEQQFLETIHQSGLGPYADLKISTYNWMAQEMVFLFWPLVARKAGFHDAYRPPTLLTYDLAQLLMWYTVEGLIRQGAFVDLRLRPQQIVSQVLDTLNRAALNGLSLEQATERQIATWVGEADRVRHLQEAAAAARTFRQACLDNNLLDLSLVVEVFDTQVVQHPEFRRYFSERYRHLIVDNVEEQSPAGQNFVVSLMTATESTAVAYDAGGGYKRFLAADPTGANQFYRLSDHTFEFNDSFIAPPDMINLAHVVENQLMHTTKAVAGAEKAIISVVNGRYRREMVANTIGQLQDILVEEEIEPGDIAIITPYLDGVLRYTLTQELKRANLPYYLLRRRSSPREEPRVRAWLTWLALAHPQWGVYPAAYDVAEALTLSIAGLDPARAELIASQLYRPDEPILLPVADLPDKFANRIDPLLLDLVEQLRLWLEAAGQRHLSLDAFLYALFNELLSQAPFQPEPDLAGAAVCDWLVQVAARMRQAAEPMGWRSLAETGKAFIDGINQGLVTANPPELGEPPDLDGIMISTVYGYLLSGKPVRVQVWLEVAATGWWEIPNQPLSNAFVLAQSWPAARQWTMDDDFRIRNQLLSRIVRGLTARCSNGIILANSELDRRGLREEGILWRTLAPVREKLTA